jgi:superfamily II DNA or RNA helicase
VTPQLRPYQRACVDALFQWVSAHDGHPLLCVPTGGGKSLIIGTVVAEVRENAPGARALILAHRKELIQQNVRAVASVMPLDQIGIYSAGLKRRDTTSPIIVAGIQSIARKPYDLGAFDVILIDEAHLVPTEDDTLYRKFIDAARLQNPYVRFVGLTATPYRLGHGLLHRGKGALFTDIVYDATVKSLIADGYLCPLISKATLTQLDTAGVATRGGEFVPGALEAAVDKDDTTAAAVAEMCRLFEGRNKWLIFCAGVKHAQHVADALLAAGIPAAAVHGEMPDEDRRRTLDDFKAGAIRAITSMDVLTTGYDEPGIDAIALLRPTKSTGLYVQMVGRGFRLSPGKANCIAKGQRVLTDQGLVPIEHVTSVMRVWDGVEFVAHHGVISQGLQETIEYAGLTATPDHRVWTEEGWKTFGQCASEQTPVAVGGIGRKAVRETDRYFRRGGQKNAPRETAFIDALCDVRRRIAQGLHQCDEVIRRLSHLWTPASGAEMAVSSSGRGERALHQSERSLVPGLWRPWDSVSLCLRNGDGSVDSGEPWPASGTGDRSNQQRRTLRGGQSPLRLVERTESEHAPGGQTAEVFDILNAGLRHRFVVEGLIVSNCLILDFAGNVARHGPVDAIEVKDKSTAGGEGAVPTKVCPNCQSIEVAGARLCTVCSFEFPAPPEKPMFEPASDLPILSTEPKPTTWHDVTMVEYHYHVPNGDGKLPSLRVEYFQNFKCVGREWVCLEHDGFARSKAEGWWKRRSAEPVPSTIEDAVRMTDELLTPSKIATQPDGRWTRIIEFVLPDPPAAPSLTRACWTCRYWSEKKACCRKWDATPPADVQANGCETWTEIEVPF